MSTLDKSKKLLNIRYTAQLLRDQIRAIQPKITLEDVRQWRPPYGEGGKPMSTAKILQEATWAIEESMRELRYLDVRLAEIRGQLRAGNLAHQNVYVVSVPTFQRHNGAILRMDHGKTPDAILRSFVAGDTGVDGPTIVDGPYTDLPEGDEYYGIESAKRNATRRAEREKTSRRRFPRHPNVYHAYQVWRITPNKCELLFSVDPQEDPTPEEKQAFMEEITRPPPVLDLEI